VSLEKAQATFELKPGKELQPDVLRKVVLDAGFTPRDIFISSRGRLQEMDGSITFQPTGSSQSFTVLENSELTKLRSEGLKKIGLDAKLIGNKASLSLEIQGYFK